MNKTTNLKLSLDVEPLEDCPRQKRPGGFMPCTAVQQMR
jgi:hypothetical protein